MNCGAASIPPANFAGKSRLDPNVAAYGELLKWVEARNGSMELGDKILNNADKRIKALEDKILALEQNAGCKCPVAIPEEDMGKLDKQTIPTKEPVPSNSGSGTPKNNEPRNKGGKTVVKVRKLKKPTKKSMSEKTVDGPN
jgi:hypothetical protein